MEELWTNSFFLASLKAYSSMLFLVRIIYVYRKLLTLKLLASRPMGDSLLGGFYIWT